MIEYAGTSNKGKIRKNNEDSFIALPDQRLFAVADGVGGSQNGEQASKAAINMIANFVRTSPFKAATSLNALGKRMSVCIKAANDSVRNCRDTSKGEKRAATTLVMCYIGKETAYFVNIGDSRAYICRGGQVFRITEDHTYVNELVKLGVITAEESKTHEKRHALTKALGAERKAEPDFYQTGLIDGDVIILCSDGLYNELSEEEITNAVSKYPGMADLCANLVRKANEAGGHDNITALCVKFSKGGK